MKQHGYSRSKIYSRWRLMLNRCNNPNDKRYPHYGGRGIKVCDRWLEFPNFLADMGEGFSEDLTLDRTDVNGNYEPSNCRWITNTEQQSNKRNNHLIEIDGDSKTLADWTRATGIPKSTLINRINAGVTGSSLLKIPRKKSDSIKQEGDKR